MKLTLVTTGGGKFEGRHMSDWEVHRFGCADVKRMRGQVTNISHEEAESPEALVKHCLEVDLEDMGYSESDFRIMPCCGKACIFQGYDGLIYGDTKYFTPSEAGKKNAQNHKDGVQGSWVPKSALKPEELERKAAPGCLSGFQSPCIFCGQMPIVKGGQ